MPTIIRVLKSWRRETHKAGATDRKAAWRAFENGHLDPISREPGAALVPPLVRAMPCFPNLLNVELSVDTALHYYVHILSRFVTSCRNRCPLIRDVNHHRGNLIQVKEIRPRKEKKQQAALLPLWPPSLVASRRWRAVKKLKSLSLSRRPIDEMVGQLILRTAVLLLIDFWTSSLLGFQFILLSF